jgi:hypothetical protein
VRFWLLVLGYHDWKPPSKYHLSPVVMVVLQMQKAGYSMGPRGVWQAVQDIRDGKFASHFDPAKEPRWPGRHRIPAIYTNPEIRHALGLTLK